MDILWEKSPRTLEEISELVSSENHWTVHAIQILLKRLIQKEAVREENILGRP
jgi:predicted transcriptional regulator